MYLDAFLTEYDDTLNSELNVDPLGLQIIWSAFGQAIFRNRINSVTNDVRNYTINLFHHYVIKNLVEDHGIVLGKALQERYESKQELNFKYACLIHMENLLVYSMISQQRENTDTAGILGISKARRKWNESGGNPELRFGHESECQVLARQVMLGVSGRYKTPLAELKFFDREYRYDRPESMVPWQKAEHLIKQNAGLLRLFEKLRKHLLVLIRQRSRRGLRMHFRDVDPQLKSAYVDAFASPVSVGSYAGAFWVGLTGLNSGAAGAIYHVLRDSMLSSDNKILPLPGLFEQAEKRVNPDERTERAKLTHVRKLEPYLSALDLMFSLMLTRKKQNLQDVVSAWEEMGRNEQTLPGLAAAITGEAIFSCLSPTGKSRLEQLLKVSAHPGVSQQLEALLSFHSQVMEGRGQHPWVRLQGKTLELNIQPRRAPRIEERGPEVWIHTYYIPQFKNLLRGLWGIRA